MFLTCPMEGLLGPVVFTSSGREPVRTCPNIKRRILRCPLWATQFIVVALLAACGDSSKTASRTTLASTSDVTIVNSQQGATPFISFVQLRGESLAKLAVVRFSINPKPGTVSKPVGVSYTIDALNRRGYAVAGSGVLTLPVFGLYAGYANRLLVDLQFEDASTQSFPVDITAAAYMDPNSVYDRPIILKARAPGSEIGFNFFAMKSGFGTPIVIDTDGEIRWVGVGTTSSFSTIFQDNAFVVGAQDSRMFSRIELDGSSREASLIPATYTAFHHNIDPGKHGLLAEVNALNGGVANIESILAEFTDAGAVIKEWDFAALLDTYMRSRGDDPSAFIRPGVDWFHMNAATYDPRDDSLIVSSRENFVIKVDYRTGDVIWILGDPTKYWYTFPSLQARALRLELGGLYPIGQHATSITSDGLLMLFNDGGASFNQPAGAPAGESRAYS